MQSLNCIIVDDEPIARRGMRRLVELRDELTLVGSASNVAEADRLIHETGKEIHLIFLDIDMEGENGLDYARRLGEGSKVIFTTAYADYAIDSYEVEAADFLLKPIRKERFNRAVDRAVDRVEREERESMLSDRSGGHRDDKYITVKADRKFVRIPVADIIYIEGMGDYLVIHLSGRRLTTRLTFKAMENLLADSEVKRVNKSYMVNIRRIEAFDVTEIHVGGITIPVGGTYKEVVRRMME
ncbi:MAG: LytTR family DNA-binding domain-containing protein [Muribaculaceae bacterium]|nr:LytTR family DNA-binding domain-containing protein [Muribaculaceae bacterium]